MNSYTWYVFECRSFIQPQMVLYVFLYIYAIMIEIIHIITRINLDKVIFYPSSQLFGNNLKPL